MLNPVELGVLNDSFFFQPCLQNNFFSFFFELQVIRDYHFLWFHEIGQQEVTPNSIPDEATAERLGDEYFFFDAIRFIFKVCTYTYTSITCTEHKSVNITLIFSYLMLLSPFVQCRWSLDPFLSILVCCLISPASQPGQRSLLTLALFCYSPYALCVKYCYYYHPYYVVIIVIFVIVAIIINVFQMCHYTILEFKCCQNMYFFFFFYIWKDRYSIH